ncbi:hypothetical protein K437DRAFT_161479 [Tilletiaria anomala UBC 951]|uniref:Uncharacterized protein n=1 Tax=Tilletiaria anomala (strain ATCC 24038 / CBS 436.72 / UBC 951) TaxID=1037660 RepID=A0A066WFC7_TILAU|nr:uncharacterized protein K437DRAFT_161479 [Tilletiaria anomala UBC 951]KDN52682.1 hypothetical protein K437DRAFT_161479 [Tilletiaria anomala UBC 951]
MYPVDGEGEGNGEDDETPTSWVSCSQSADYGAISSRSPEVILGLTPLNLMPDRIACAGQKSFPVACPVHIRSYHMGKICPFGRCWNRFAGSLDSG